MINQRPQEVYTYVPREGYEWLSAVSDDDYERMKFDGTSRRSSWVPIRVTRVKVWEDGSLLAPGDFPPCGFGLTVSRAAVEQLSHWLNEAGELLPLECEDGEFWKLNVTCMVDALDEENSKFLRSTDTGHILMVTRHAFRAARLRPEIFKLSQSPRGLIYFTEAFVQRVKATNLKGIDFKLVWAAN